MGVGGEGAILDVTIAKSLLWLRIFVSMEKTNFNPEIKL